jgi:hypothetical protein
LTGPLVPPGYAPTGRRAAFEGVGLHEYRDHLLVGLRVDFDVMDVARQLGLLPARASIAERALARAQRAGMRALRRLARDGARGARARRSTTRPRTDASGARGIRPVRPHRCSLRA